jgi:Flp pilus assembly protein TadG
VARAGGATPSFAPLAKNELKTEQDMRVDNSSNLRRRGTITVEAAIVLPMVFMFIIAMCLISLGTYYYQQVASLAREGARYASVNGPVIGNSGKMETDIYNNAIQPMAAGLNTGALTYEVQWGTAVSGSLVWTPWDSSSRSPTSYNPNSNPPGATMNNAVKVTVTYQWTPGLYLTGPINLTSTSEMPMSY